MFCPWVMKKLMSHMYEFACVADLGKIYMSSIFQAQGNLKNKQTQKNPHEITCACMLTRLHIICV